jgi:rubrerythrin
MQTYICQICGDAYIGERKPSECPFCGAREHFIKIGKEALPILNQETKINETDKKNLLETLDLETKANAIYLCMASKAKTYEIKAMYKRLAKVELEHAVIVTKILKIELPNPPAGGCSEEEVENFQKTIELENHATELYAEFAKASEEQNIKILFTALTQVEEDHIKLIKNYI